MGSCLSALTDQSVLKSRLELCQSITFMEVLECFNYYQKHFCKLPILNSDQFEDVFSPILANTIEYYNKFEYNEGVNIKEILGPLFLFTKGFFDEKLGWLIKLYEKEAGKIPKDEIVELIQNTARGIWKWMFVRDPGKIEDVSKKFIEVPGYMELEIYARKEFPELGEQKIKWISSERIINWFKDSVETQELLFLITNCQTYERAKKEFVLLLEKCKAIFSIETVSFMDERFAPTLRLKSNFAKTFPFLKPEEINEIFDILSAPYKGIILEEEYDSLTHAMIAFKVTDVKKEGVLRINSIKTLLWLLIEEEPNEKKVSQEISLLHLSPEGSLDMLSWIRYNVCTKTPEILMGSRAKAEFNRFDFNCDGKLDEHEFTALLQDKIKQELLMKSLDGDISEHAKKTIEGFAHDIMNKLDVNPRKGYLNWLDFKEYRNKVGDQQNKLLIYLY